MEEHIMNIKLFTAAIFICLGLVITSANLSGCAAGGHIGPVGGSAVID